MTQDELKSFLEYNPDTGIFRCLKKRKHVRADVGDVVGSLYRDGYIQIELNNKRYQAHRLAFLYMTGSFPGKFTDHIDGNRANNAWFNLRECSYAENSQNRGMMNTNTSGYIGVFYEKCRGKWIAAIGVDGKDIRLGRFSTAEEARDVYLQAKKKYHKFSPSIRG